MTYEYSFNGRKPSNQQVLKQVNHAINSGHDLIEINWGENSINLRYWEGAKQWHGIGWIRNISGADIATKINQVEHKRILNLYNT